MTMTAAATAQTADGVDLHVTVSDPPDAQVAVVYLHGWCLSSEIYRYQRAALTDLGVPARVVTYDMRGHGRSGKAPRGSTTIAQLASDLRVILDEFCDDLPAILVGHSMGAMTIMALAEVNPRLFSAERVAGVIFANTAAGDLGAVTLGLPRALAGVTKSMLMRELTRRHNAHLRRGDGPVRLRVSDAAIARHILFGRGAAREDVRLGRRLICTAHPGVVEGFFADLLLHNRHEALARLAEVPVRVLAGGRDRLTPVGHSRRIAKALPNARLVVYPGAGHMIPLERSDELAREIAQLATHPRRLSAGDIKIRGG
ncbi:MAG: alpha/beta fold hydrolase [Micromonosporaceae bacterium]|nr:alpha/beta fold hydrolase [Micromonosporaceae bacterium]